MSEFRTLAGGVTVGSETLVQADQDTVVGDGTPENPLFAVDSGTFGLTIRQAGSPVANQVLTLNFTGTGVGASPEPGRSRVAAVEIPDGSVVLEDGGVALPGGPHRTLNFTGAGVSVVGAGSVARVTVPGGVDLLERGVAVDSNPQSTLNFTGQGVTATDVGGVATVNIPAVAPAPPQTFNSTFLIHAPALGMAVVASGSDQSDAANPNSVATAQVTGLVSALIDGTHATVQFRGILTLATAQWDLRTGQTGGLTPQAAYYLDVAIVAPGRITSDKPVLASVAQVGVAITTTQLLLSTPCVPTEIA